MQASILLTVLALTVSLAMPESVRTELPKQDTQIEQPAPADQGTEREKTSFVLHAGGVTPDGKVGTDSLEALNYSYALGYDQIEIDFCWTSDHELACVHDWTTRYGIGHVPSAAEFEELRTTYYDYTSLTLPVLTEWMREHPEVTIVTDIKEQNPEGAAYISRYCPDLLDRFVIQIYSRDEYEAVRDCGFSHIWLTLYQLPWNVKTNTALLAGYAKECGLEALVFSSELVPLPGYVDQLKKIGIPLYVHTVNGKEEQDAMRAAGIDGIYTDRGDAYAEW